MPSNIFDEEPSTSAPYAAGKVSDEALRAALNRLNALRQIAGLPGVELSSSWCEEAQYGAVLLAASQFSHTPRKPSDMDQDFYDIAYDATSSSNIYAGVTLTQAVDGFMDDSDSTNIDRLGHRRWQLNAAMEEVGFGYAMSRSGYGRYVDEKVFDRDNYSYYSACTDYDFIAWPASGNFPTELFDPGTAWALL